MLERFYQVFCKQKALIDIYPVQDNSIGRSHDEVIILSKIIKDLILIKAKVKALFHRNTSLYTADITVDIMLNKLKYADNSISKILHAALMLRMQER